MRGLGLGMGGCRAVRRRGVRGGPVAAPGQWEPVSLDRECLPPASAQKGWAGCRQGRKGSLESVLTLTQLFMVLKIALSDVMGF